MSEQDRSPLALLIGQPLFGIKFVHDYIRFEFAGPDSDGHWLIVGTPPTMEAAPLVRLGDIAFEWESPGYRDALCALLDLVVHQAIVVPNESIVIEFENGASVSVTIRAPTQPPETDVSVIFGPSWNSEDPQPDRQWYGTVRNWPANWTY